MYSLTRRLHHLIHRPRLDGFSALTINYLLMQLAVEMVGSFGVLFVWQLGRDWRQGLFLILLFFGFQRIVVGLSLLPIGYLYSRIQHQWIMAAAQGMLIAKLWILSRAAVVSGQPIPYGMLFLAFALGGVYIGAYYVGFHSLFLFDSQEKNVGKDIGLIDMLGRFSGIIAPLFAGIIVERFGFSVMFIVAMVLLAFSNIPLFLMRHRHISVSPVSIRSVADLLKHEPHFSLSTYFWLVEDSIGSFFWPVFLILVLKNYATFGAVGSIVMIVSSVMVYLSGYLYDKRPLRRIFPAAAAASSLMWVVRFLSTTPVTVGVADVVHRLISPVWWMKISRYGLAVGERVDRMTFSVAHETMVTLGALTGLGIGYSLLVIGNLNWYWLLVPTLGGILMSTRTLEEK